MNEELQSLVERAMAAGRSREQILTVLKDNGLDDAGVLSVDSYIKKKSPSALEESASQSDLRPSVSESLSSERVQLGFDEAAIKQQKKAIADAAAAQVYTAVAQTKGDLNKIQDKQAFANAYTTYRSLSDDPRAATLPQNPVTQTGEVDYAVVPTLKKGAIDYVNELIKQEQQRKADLGSKFTVPVISEVAAGAESIVGGLLKFNEMITGNDSELASFFLDDAAQRSRDALIDYGLTEEQISKGFLGNIGEGNVGAGLAIFGSTLVQQVPQLAAVAATGGAAGLGLLGASAAGSGYAELQNRSDLSEGEKMLYGIGVGAAEYLAEKLFLGDVNMLRKAFSKEAIEGMTKKELGDMLFGAVPKGVRSVMEEGTEEVLTSVAQQTLAKVIAGEEFDPIEIAESAIYGGAAGGGVYLLSRGAGAIVDPDNEAKIRDLQNGLKNTQEASQDPDITTQEKEVLKRRADEYTVAIEELKKLDDEKVASMSAEDQASLKSLQKEFRIKSAQLKLVKSDAAAQQLKSEARGILDNIKQLSEKYDRQEEAGVPSPVVEGQAPVEAQPIEGSGTEAPEAGGVFQVSVEEEPVVVGDLVNKRVTYSDPVSGTLVEGDLFQEGQRLIVETDGGQQFDLGNIEDLSPQELAGNTLIQAATETVVPNQDGSLVYNLKGNQKIPYETRMFNREEGLRSIKRDANGNIARVTLQNQDGTETYNLTGKEAEDAAYYIMRDFAQRPENAATLEDLIQRNNEARAQLEQATITEEVAIPAQEPTAEAVEAATVEPTGTVEEVITEVRPKNRRGLSDQEVDDSVAKAEKLARRLGLTTKIVVFNTRKQYNDAINETSKTGLEKNSVERGRYIPSTNEIYLNLEDVTAEVPFHEVFHAAFISKYAKGNQAVREKVATDFYNGIVKILRNGNEQDQLLADAVDSFVKSGNYTPKESPEEFLAQTAGFLSTSGDKISKSTMDKLIQWLNNFISKIAPGIKINTRGEFIDFMNSFSGALFESSTDKSLEEIAEEGSYTPAEPVVMPDLSESASRFDEEKAPNWLKDNIANLKALAGRKIPFAVFYDNTRVGKSTLKNKVTGKESNRNLMGGFGYSQLEGVKFEDNGAKVSVLAFTNEDMAARKLSEYLRKEGDLIPVAMQNTQTGHLGNLDVVYEMFDDVEGVVSTAPALYAQQQTGKKSGPEFEAARKAAEDEILGAIKQSVIELADKPEQNKKKTGPSDRVKAARSILPMLDDINTLAEWRDKILLGEWDSFGTRGLFNAYMLQAKPSRETKSTREVHKILHGKYGVPTVKELADGITEESFNNAELGDVIKFVSPEKNPVIYTTDPVHKDLPKEGVQKKSDKMTYTLKYIGDQVDSHVSYPYILAGQNDGFAPSYIDITEIFPDLRGKVKKSQSFYAAGRRSLAAPVGEVESIYKAQESEAKKANKVYENILKESSSRSLDELMEARKTGLVIHATKRDFDSFNPERIYGSERAVYGYGFYFTGSPSKAMDYGDKFIFTPISKYNLVDVEEKLDANYIEFLNSKYIKLSRIIDEQGQDIDVDILRKNLRNIRAIILNMESMLKDGKIVTIDATRKRLDDAYIMNYREFSGAFKTLGYDGFHVDDYYQVVIFNFDKLNDNLVKNEKEYLSESSSRSVREEILDREQESRLDRAKRTATSFIWNPTQKKIRVFKERMTSQLSVEGREIKKFSKRMNALLDKADEETLGYVNDIMDGVMTPSDQRKLEAKPNGREIFTLANAMRNYIDSFANDFINDPAFHSLPDTIVDTIIENFGQYMRGSYRFWKDKNYKPTNEARRDAIVYEYNILQAKKIQELVKKEGFTEEEAGEVFELFHDETLAEATKAIDGYIAEIEKIRGGDDFKKMGIISPSSIKLPSDEFTRRKNLPQTIKNLLGEETDPLIRFIDTTVALSNIKYKGHMLYAISESLGGTNFIKNEATDAEITSGEYRLVKDKFSPLNGRYVHKDVFEAITDPKIYEADNIWMQGYLSTLQLARKSKVIYNVPTWRKNLTGGWYTMVANGVINPEFVKDLGRRAQLFAKGEADPETEAWIKIMGDNGLIGQDVNANLIGFTNAMYSRTLTGNDQDYMTYVQRGKNLIKNFDTVVGQKYAAVDDYTKLIVFRTEVESFAKKLYGKSYKSLTANQKETVHAEAAEYVKQNTPTFSRLPKWYAKLAKIPAGDFLSFEFEALRSFSSNIYNGQKDLMKGMTDKSLTPEQKAEYIKAGTRRLVGSASIMGARMAITSVLAAAAMGDDDELTEDVKKTRPNWMEGHSIIPVAVTKDGIATVYDYSMEDPYGSFFDLATDPLSFPAYTIDLLQPNMGITFLMNLAENKDFYGRDIVNSYDSKLTKGYKYTEHTLKSLIVPPFISSAYRDEQKRKEVEADKYSELDALGRFASRMVIRDYQYNIGVQFYYFTDKFRTKKEQYSDLTGASRDNRLAELDEIKAMYQSIVNIGIKKGNYQMIADANKNVKRALKPLEEAYVLYGYELPEQK